MILFVSHLWIQLKMDIRDKGTLLTYYLVPLIFYAVMSAVFSSINPDMKNSLIPSMTIFAVTMGAVLGMPGPLIRMRETSVLKGLRVSGISSWRVFSIQAVSAGIHLALVSLIIFFSSPLIFGAQIPVSIPYYIIILAALLFTMLSIGLMIGAAAKNNSFAMILSQAVFLPTMLLGGIMFPSELLPPPLRAVSYVLPSTYFVQAFAGSAYDLQVNIKALPSLLIACSIGTAALVFANIRCRSITKV